MIPDVDYFLPAGYQSRPDPEYFHDEGLNAVWQPDVYPDAASLARRLGAKTIVDVGCGAAEKLAALHPEFELIGIDYGPNIALCQATYPFGKWIERDFDSASDLGYDASAGSVIVCADVLEHLVHPERLLTMIRAARERGAAALVFSTPDRTLIEDADHLGPPTNPAHVREWSLAELGELLHAFDLPAYLGHTRSNDVMPFLRTSFAVVPGTDASNEATVADWFEDRAKWERLAVEQDALIADLQRWNTELTTAKEWLAEELDQLHGADDPRKVIAVLTEQRNLARIDADEARKKLSEIVTSRSWRILTALRGLRRPRGERS
jgi:SAM-dependent methyltransferase